MQAGDIPYKTEDGQSVLQSRAGGLTLKQRSLLIMADGRRSVAELQHAAEGLGLPPDALATLQALGYIGLRSPKPSPTPAAAAPVRAVEPPPAAPTTPEIPKALNADTERYLSLQRAMLQLAVENLGLRSFLFTLKIEKCSSIQDLRALLPDLSGSLRKAKGEPTAERLMAPLQAALAEPAA